MMLLTIGTTYFMDYEIVTLDPCLPLTIGRSDKPLLLLLIDFHPMALWLSEGSTASTCSSERRGTTTALAFPACRTD
jgi:hypothetical protein